MAPAPWSSAGGRDQLGILDFEHEIDGSGGPALCMPAGGSRQPASHETVDQRLHYVKQEGQKVFKFAVRKTGDVCERLLQRNKMTGGDIDLFVSHQANRRIIMSAAERLGLPEEKVVINIERFGNTTAATIPLALNDAVNAGRLKKGDSVLLASVGAGFTVGAMLVRWASLIGRSCAGIATSYAAISPQPASGRLLDSCFKTEPRAAIFVTRTVLNNCHTRASLMWQLLRHGCNVVSIGHNRHEVLSRKRLKRENPD